MINFETFTQLTNQLQKMIPKNIYKVSIFTKKLIKKILKYHLKHMNLITREEFDVQTKILKNTQKKIKKAELKIQELTKHIKK